MVQGSGWIAFLLKAMQDMIKSRALSLRILGNVLIIVERRRLVPMQVVRSRWGRGAQGGTDEPGVECPRGYSSMSQRMAERSLYQVITILPTSCMIAIHVLHGGRKSDLLRHCKFIFLF